MTSSDYFVGNGTSGDQFESLKVFRFTLLFCVSGNPHDGSKHISNTGFVCLDSAISCVVCLRD